MYHIFVNPSSRSGRGLAIWKKTEAYLQKYHIAYQLHYTKKNRSLRPEFEEILLKDQRERIPLLVIGGDGTLNQCVNGIPDPDRFELSYLPAGSGNDFCRNKTLPATLSEKLDSILNRQHEMLIDIGALELTADTKKPVCRKFLVSSGIGYDAEICHAVEQTKLKDRLNKFHLGKVVYLMIGLKDLFETKLCDMEVTVNGKTKQYRNVFFLVSMNQPYEGGGLPMAPDATDTDGVFTFLIAHDISRLKALTLIPLLALGKHVGKRGLDLIEGKEITAKMSFPKVVHSDGEVLGTYRQYHAAVWKKIRFIY